MGPSKNKSWMKIGKSKKPRQSLPIACVYPAVGAAYGLWRLTAYSASANLSSLNKENVMLMKIFGKWITETMFVIVGGGKIIIWS